MARKPRTVAPEPAPAPDARPLGRRLSVAHIDAAIFHLESILETLDSHADRTTREALVRALKRLDRLVPYAQA